MKWWAACLIVLGGLTIAFLLLSVISAFILCGQIDRELGDK